MKRAGKCFLSLLCLSSLIGCNQKSYLPAGYFPTLVPKSDYSASAKKRNDWFANLRPELQEYYAEAKGKTGNELFESLHRIISRDNAITDYNSAREFMYGTADNILVNNKRGVLTAYSQIFMPGQSTVGNDYQEKGDENGDSYPGDWVNCEHTWPQSYFERVQPMLADLHHLMPVFNIPNAKRGNYPFGEVNGTVVYSTNSGSKLFATEETSKKVSPRELKRLSELPEKSRDNLMLKFEFEPADGQKGNTARAAFYFFLRYHKEKIRSGEFNEKAFWDSKIEMFRKWSEKVDPVDANEIRRNDLIFGLQKNRNPFIDIPNLPSLIGDQVFIKK